MKRIVLTLFVLTLFVKLGSAQGLKVSPDTKLITYDTVISLEGKTADQIFDKTKAWFVEYFREAKEVIRGENKPSMIKGTFSTRIPAGLGTITTYESDLVIRIKDGAIKIVADNITFVSPQGHRSGTSGWVKADGTLRTGGLYQKPMRALENEYRALSLNLRAYMDKKDDF